MNDLSKSKIKVMLVDDSAVVRGLISRMLSADPGIEVVSSVHDGSVAVKALDSIRPDIMLLDIEMPIMDGLTAIPLLLEKQPHLKIIMCSTLTVENGAQTMKAFSLGAADCIAKPTSSGEINKPDAFGAQLIHKIKAIGEGLPARPAPRTAMPVKPGIEVKPTSMHPGLPREIKLRPQPLGITEKPAILAIGSSTGGPPALFEVIKHFQNFKIPIVLTQHMPPTFTRILAEHITAKTGVKAFEAQEGMTVEPGICYVAQGGKHMTLRKSDASVQLHLDDGPPENYCKPAVDVMLRSLLPIYGSRIFTVILTGMGQDGMKASREIVERGGTVIAQDEATSTVWGMPGAVALSGLCSAVLPLNDIGLYVQKAVLR